MQAIPSERERAAVAAEVIRDLNLLGELVTHALLIVNLQPRLTLVTLEDVLSEAVLRVAAVCADSLQRADEWLGQSPKKQAEICSRIGICHRGLPRAVNANTNT